MAKIYNLLPVTSNPLASLVGTRVEDAKALMAASDLKVIPCDSLNDAASMVSHIF